MDFFTNLSTLNKLTEMPVVLPRPIQTIDPVRLESILQTQAVGPQDTYISNVKDDGTRYTLGRESNGQGYSLWKESPKKLTVYTIDPQGQITHSASTTGKTLPNGVMEMGKATETLGAVMDGLNYYA
jgi:hypothetical protein